MTLLGRLNLLLHLNKTQYIKSGIVLIFLHTGGHGRGNISIQLNTLRSCHGILKHDKIILAEMLHPTHFF